MFVSIWFGGDLIWFCWKKWADMRANAGLKQQLALHCEWVKVEWKENWFSQQWQWHRKANQVFTSLNTFTMCCLVQYNAVRWVNEKVERRVKEGQSGEEVPLIETKVWTRGHRLSGQREEVCVDTTMIGTIENIGTLRVDRVMTHWHSWRTHSLKRWRFGTNNCIIGTNAFMTSQPGSWATLTGWVQIYVQMLNFRTQVLLKFCWLVGL